MIHVNLIFNLAFLVALCVVSGFMDKRWPRQTPAGALLQGLVFGAAAALGMLHPLTLEPGLIFDGRSVMVSLCALFFGPVSALAATAITLAVRIALGGSGLVTGALVILSSSTIGLAVHYRLKPFVRTPSVFSLYLMGLAVHLAMLALMMTLPGVMALTTLKRMALPIMVLYPLATILAGKILADHLLAIQKSEAAAESEERYRLLFESSLDAILLTSSDGRIHDANPAACRLFGQTAQELRQIGRDGIVDSTDPRLPAALQEHARSGSFNGTLRFKRKDGGTFEGEMSSTVFFSPDGSARTGFFIRDNTSRHQMEDALRESKMYLERLTNTMADAVFVVTFPERVIEYANDAAAGMFGYLREDILGKNSRMFFPDETEYLRGGEIFQNAVTQGRRVVRFEVALLRKSGEAFPAFFTASFLKEEDQAGRKYIVVVQDITERKHTEDALRFLKDGLEQKVAQRTRELRDSQLALLNLVDDLNESARSLTSANQSLEAVNRELEAFSYSVSHDLRAPLRTIDGFSNILEEDYADKFDAEGRDYLKRIRRAAQNMGQLIDDMLNLSRVTRQEMRLQDVDISRKAREIIEEFCKINPSRDVTVEIQDGVVVRADPNLMSILLTNLLENAWKFTEHCDQARIEFKADRRDGGTVVQVRDNGAGFDMKYVEKIFTAFQRLHRAEEYPGTGIGLATVQRIVHRHGGRIWAEGETGKGAAFYFTLGE